MFHEKHTLITELRDGEYSHKTYVGPFVLGGLLQNVGNTDWLVPMFKYRLLWWARASSLAAVVWLVGYVLGMAWHPIAAHIVNIVVLFMVLYGLYTFGPHRYCVLLFHTSDTFRWAYNRATKVYEVLDTIAVGIVRIATIVHIWIMFETLKDFVVRTVNKR